MLELRTRTNAVKLDYNPLYVSVYLKYKETLLKLRWIILIISDQLLFDYNSPFLIVCLNILSQNAENVLLAIYEFVQIKVSRLGTYMILDCRGILLQNIYFY